MIRICMEKATKKIIEIQSGGNVDRLPKTDTVTDEEYAQYLADCESLEAARLDTLRINAINQGYAESDIEVKWMTEEEWATIRPADEVLPRLYPDSLLLLSTAPELIDNRKFQAIVRLLLSQADPDDKAKKIILPATDGWRN